MCPNTSEKGGEFSPEVEFRGFLALFQAGKVPKRIFPSHSVTGGPTSLTWRENGMGQCQQQEKKGKWTLFVWDEEGKVLFQSQHGVDLVCSGRLNMMRERTGVGIRLENQTAFFL